MRTLDLVHLHYIPHNFNKLTWDFAVSTALTRNIPHSKPTENGKQVVETKTLCGGTSSWYFSYPLFTSLRVNQWRSAHIGFPRALANFRNVCLSPARLEYQSSYFKLKKHLNYESFVKYASKYEHKCRPISNGKFVV